MMTSTLSKTLWLLLIFGCSSPIHPSGSDFFITGTSIGRVKLGQRAEEAIQAYRDHEVKEVDLLLEGMPAPAVQVYERGRILLTAELEDRVVYRISTRDPRFQTKDGLHIGTTLSAASSSYGRPVVADGEDGLFAIYEMQNGIISLLLDTPYGNLEANQSDRIVAIFVVRHEKR